MKTFFLLFILVFADCSQPVENENNLSGKPKAEQNSNLQIENVAVNRNQPVITDTSFLRIESSPLLTRLEKKKAENPQVSEEDLAILANELIPQYGVNFWVDLSDLIVKKTKSKEVQELDDMNVRFNFNLTLNPAKGQKNFQIDSPTDSCCCGYAYADFPVSNITGTQMTVIIDEKHYKIKRTKDISFSQEYILLDEKTKSKKIRSWQVPFETSPYGISEDGTKLYIEYETTGLLLEIADDGRIQFVTKNFPNIIANGKDLREFPEPKIGEIIYKSGENGLMLFKSGTKNYIIDFPYVCT